MTLGQRVLALLEQPQTGLSLRELHRRTGIPLSALSDLIHDKRAGMSARNVAKIAVVLGVAVDALMNDGPLPQANPPALPALPLETLHPVLAAAVRKWGRNLTDQDYTKLAGYLEGLAREAGWATRRALAEPGQPYEAPEDDLTA